MRKEGADQYKMWRLEQKERWEEEEVKRKNLLKQNSTDKNKPEKSETKSKENNWM